MGQLGQPVVLKGFVDSVTVAAVAPETFLSLRALSTISVSVKTLRRYLELPDGPLPHYRMPTGTIIVKRSDWETWAESFRTIGRPNVDRT